MKTRPLDSPAPSPEVQELLRRRSQKLEAPRESVEDDAVVFVAEFPVGEELFAIAVETLRAALPLRMVTPVPLAPPEVVGVMRHQGEILTVLSMASLLGVRGWRTDPAVVLVVEHARDQLVALDCEQVPKPTGLPPGAVATARGAETGPVAQVLRPGGRPVNLIDVSRLLATRRG